MKNQNRKSKVEKKSKDDKNDLDYNELNHISLQSARSNNVDNDADITRDED